MKRTFAAVVAVCLSLVWWAGPAAADYQSTTETSWMAPGPGQCLRTRAEASSSDVQGPYWTFTASAEDGTDRSGSCDTGPANVAPAGWLAARADLYRWDGQAWQLCAAWGWSTSDTSAESFQQSWGGGYGPCGGGWYGVTAYAAVWDGSAWQGADHGVWSGYVWLEDAGGRAAAPNRG